MSEAKVFGRTTLGLFDFLASPAVIFFRFVLVLLVSLLLAFGLWLVLLVDAMKFLRPEMVDAPFDPSLVGGWFFRSPAPWFALGSVLVAFASAILKIYFKFNRMVPGALDRYYELDAISILSRDGAGVTKIWPWSSLKAVKLTKKKLVFREPSSGLMAIPTRAFCSEDRKRIGEFVSMPPLSKQLETESTDAT
ncbi:hypothetical protein [Methylosinus sp. LW4]|uniref:hypothetical protein n=1 Tax=Methylosinus sp. LW4 TaxID=136993 RepID=UPI0005C2889B|nr:hypothetical protein [Methylosinus sp. LW4]